MAKKTDKPLDYTEFIDSLKNNNLSPVYIFYGDEEYFITEALRELRKYLSDKYGELEYMSADRGSTPLRELIFSANSRSLFGSKKLIVVNDSDKFTNEENAILEEYLQKPGNGTYLVLKYSDGRKIKLDMSNLFLVNFPRDGKNILIQLRRIIESRNYKITNDALRMLTDLVGNNLVELSNEVNKLLVYLKDSGDIKKSDIEKYIKRTNYSDIFQLINAVCNKDSKLALKTLSDLESMREEPIAIINRISWRLRQIWQVKQLKDRGLSNTDIMSELKISSGNLYYIQKQSRNFDYEDIKIALNNIYKTDLKLKSTQIPPYDLLTKSVIEMCR